VVVITANIQAARKILGRGKGCGNLFLLGMTELDFKLVIDSGSQYLYFTVNAATWDFERTENPLSRSHSQLNSNEINLGPQALCDPPDLALYFVFWECCLISFSFLYSNVVLLCDMIPPMWAST
jgi:hypothetical protein